MSLLDYLGIKNKRAPSVPDIATKLVLEHRVPIDDRFQKIMEIGDENVCRKQLLNLARSYRINVKEVIRG